MKNKTLLFISLLLSSSILHADLNPLGGVGTDMVKDAATDAVKEKVTDTAKGMAKDAMKPAPADAAKDTKAAAPATADAPKAVTESKPTMTETATTKVKKVVRKKLSTKRH
jgi:predicted small secreted protein